MLNWLVQNAVVLLFGAALVVIGMLGMLGVAYVCVLAIEWFLPEDWRAKNILFAREQRQIEQSRQARLAQMRAKRADEQMAERLLKKQEPTIEVLDSLSGPQSIDTRPYEGFAEEPKPQRPATEEFQVPIDLTDEVVAVAKPRYVQPARVRRVVVCKHPLTEKVMFLMGLSRGGRRTIWAAGRRQARVYLSTDVELTAHINLAEQEGHEVFICLADSKPKAKAATA